MIRMIKKNLGIISKRLRLGRLESRQRKLYQALGKKTYKLWQRRQIQHPELAQFINELSSLIEQHQQLDKELKDIILEGHLVEDSGKRTH